MLSCVVNILGVSVLLHSVAAIGLGSGSGSPDDIDRSRALGLKSAALFKSGGCL